ncbi:MAG: arginine--tRNA ligase [Lachnospiraceae bacterium]|nr:arginine--tRNA ligase [Lachnospiraceae bacterium]
MKSIAELISEEVKTAFNNAGYDPELGQVTVSNRPDLCEFQCNGAMAGAKLYHKAPIQIATEVADKLKDNRVIESALAVNPGFLNINIKGEWLAEYLTEMAACPDGRLGIETPETQTVIVDYGGANVAKPLHVGHLRSAVIGESIKRISRYMGHKTIGDVHLGDWGLQMGLVITELKQRKPDLPYFDDEFCGEYPKEAPFTIAELEEIYPTASAKSKEDEEFKRAAMEATAKLQSGVRGYRALWKHIIDVSVADLKRNYDSLDVEFDLWKGESDVHDLIPSMVDYLKAGGYTRMSDGALVVDVKEDTDNKEMPPCMILKSDGASLYNTTDLATIMDRVKQYNPDRLVYLTDKRQNLYFEQVFRCARKTGLIDKDKELIHIGFGTVNGKDGKPFKTRDGGVMRLEYLIKDINDRMYERITQNRDIDEDEALKISRIVGLAAIKYGDLSNQASKDYIFDVDKFTSSEGNTGPYILYTIVRIKSILDKYSDQGGTIPDIDSCKINFIAPVCSSHKNLMMELTGFAETISGAYTEAAPHRICAYIYGLANAFNSFYHEVKVLAEEDADKKEGYIALLALTKKVLTICIDLLGFKAPDRM